MSKELHIWIKDNCPNKETLLTTFDSTNKALTNNQSKIDTTQPHFCSSTWLLKGYRIFVHMLDDKVVEIKLGYIENCTREIRAAHNLEKMLLANEFGYATRNTVAE